MKYAQAASRAEHLETNHEFYAFTRDINGQTVTKQE